jgi:tripartite-type tricarboxylate transporter receptor subunit TctC
MPQPTIFTRFRLMALGLAVAMTMLMPGLGVAQSDYPNRPITLVIPFGPGGETDIFARALSNDVAQVLGQPIVVVNRAGATGVVASEFVARSAPDGYTLIFGTAATHALNQSLFKTLPYHPLDSFEPVAFVGSVPLVLYAHPSMPSNAAELVARLKANPDKYFYGSAGISTSYLGIELFKNAAGITSPNVPYKGTGESIQGLLGGQVMFLGGSLGVGQQLAEAGKLHAVAVMSDKRLNAAPGIPTLGEAMSLPLEVGTWNVVMAPSKTPKAIVDRLNAAFNEVLRRPDVVARLSKSGISPVSDSTPESTGKRISSEIEKWRKAVELAGVQPQ